MAEYIKREDAIRSAKHAWAKGLDPSQYIEIIPPADVAPVVHAKWIMRNGKTGVCNNCNRQDHIDPLATHCPHCGAKMDFGDKND